MTLNEKKIFFISQRLQVPRASVKWHPLGLFHLLYLRMSVAIEPVDNHYMRSADWLEFKREVNIPKVKECLCLKRGISEFGIPPIAFYVPGSNMGNL